MSDEFVGYGLGVEEAQVAGGSSGSDNLGAMSERVQAMAQSLYEQLEVLVRRYGVESAQFRVLIVFSNYS